MSIAGGTASASGADRNEAQMIDKSAELCILAFVYGRES